jgi:hypothetical protein
MIEYGSADKMWWDGEHMDVRFLAIDQGRQINCRVTWEWLTPLPPHGSRRALLTHQDPVEGQT